MLSFLELHGGVGSGDGSSHSFISGPLRRLRRLTVKDVGKTARNFWLFLNALRHCCNIKFYIISDLR